MKTGEFKSVMSAWYCVGEGYYLVFEDSWKDSVTVIFDPEMGTAVFCEWDKDGKAVGNELFRIETFETENLTVRRDIFPLPPPTKLPLR